MSGPHKIHPVILAGGAGSRLWPVSRSLFPKQFQDLVTEKSLFQETALRVSGDLFAPPLVIGNEEQRFLVAEQLRELGITPAAIVLEPVGRGTATAVAVAAAYLADKGEEGALLVLPSDHVMSTGQAYEAALQAGLAATDKGCLVTFGIEPTRPSTGYGYIQRGASLGAAPEGQVSSYAIDRFLEKPNETKAQELIDQGDTYWNAGIFLMGIADVLSELQAHAPEVLATAKAALQEGDADLSFLRLGRNAFEAGPDASFDIAIMEATDKGAVVPLSLAWNDLGSWDGLWEVSDKDDAGNSSRGDVLLLDSQESFVRSDGPFTAVVGAQDMVVVATEDAVLVADKSKVQQVRQVVDWLKSKDRSERKTHAQVYRPWGGYKSLATGERYQVKRILVLPGEQLSLQLHHHRAEHWVVVRGTAQVQKGEEQLLLQENQSVYIPLGVKHRLSNPGKIPLELIEVQSGAYLGEDDIVRLEDVYGRNEGD
ncbi:mannose-1-phosphate guanylyltransferase/mannose-6-phosphate isomerase [Rhodovibrionaceae bacterium A322]